MPIDNQLVTLFNNYPGSVTINSAEAGTLDALPHEEAITGNPLQLAAGDSITFNGFQSADVHISDTDETLTELDEGVVVAESAFGQEAGFQINGGYEIDLTDSSGNIYTMTAYSYGPNNDNVDADGLAMDNTDGWVFSGENGIPPEGEELEVSAVRGYVGEPWADVAVLCFANGTYIETKEGSRLVEDLQAGDMILTVDNGYQPLKYVYKRTMPAMGSMRPVLFEKGAIGNTETIRVSQRHRMLTSGLKTPEGKVLPKDYLVWASELCNGSTIRIDSSAKEVTYFHLMFDQHELVYSAGVASESWQPTRRNLQREPELAKELLEIFPEIETMHGGNKGRVIRKEITINPERV